MPEPPFDSHPAFPYPQQRHRISVLFLPFPVGDIVLLTTDLLTKWYTGGEIEVRDYKYQTLHCGRIAEINVIQKKIRIRLYWFARAHGYTGGKEDRVRWVSTNRAEYTIPTEGLRFSAEGLFTKECSIVLTPFGSTKSITLSPRSLCLLDRNIVEGLEVEQE